MTDLLEWFLDGVPGATSAVDIAQRLGDGLVESGMPLDRLGVFVTTLHPNVLGRAFIWERGKAVRVGELTPAVHASRSFTHSPVARVFTQNVEYRWRAGEPDEDFELIQSLAAKGCVDYLALPLCFTNGEIHAVTYASNTGFSDEQLARIRRLTRALARIAEIFALRRIATTLLDTYVGKLSGSRVLAGRIARGDVETIRAAIWFSDLRGFTALSSRRTPRELIRTLNDVFDCQVPAIERRGGEVLKFIGDGLLAIFPINDTADASSRCAAALDAAAEAFAAVDALPPAGEDRLRIGLALHLGDVEYGNIGGPSRLDFTAIGPAVNLAARLEGIASKTGRPLVLSSAFATASGRACEDLGAFELKGIPEPQQVYAPAEPGS